jgi:hypothetical protein
VRRDSAEFSPGIVPPGTYVVQVLWIGYQRVNDTLAVRPNTESVEYGLWEDPLCMATREPPSRPAA